MAVRYLLDTNICIYIQRQRSPAVLALGLNALLESADA